MSGYKNFDINRVAVIVGGFPLEIESVEIEFPDSFAKRVGSQGEVARSKINDETAQVTITLLQTSASNLILDQLYEADRNSPGGVTVPVLIKDILGTTLFACLNSWAMKKPTISFGSEIADREWVLDCAQVKSTVGGN